MIIIDDGASSLTLSIVTSICSLPILSSRRILDANQNAYEDDSLLKSTLTKCIEAVIKPEQRNEIQEEAKGRSVPLPGFARQVLFSC